MSEEIPYGYCHCGCGQQTSSLQNGIKNKYIHGHNMGPMLVYDKGTRFGRLVVIGQQDRIATCVCDCGVEKRVRAADLANGHVRSCGCARGTSYKHGASRTPTYRVWCSMIERCMTPTHTSYKNYGGRGITVCERWRTFENFLADMGEKPEGLSIERKNNHLGYSPENCVWATVTEQARNKRNSRFITHNGKTQTMIAWAEEIGVSSSLICYRLKQGQSVEKALGPLVRQKKSKT